MLILFCTFRKADLKSMSRNAFAAILYQTKYMATTFPSVVASSSSSSKWNPICVTKLIKLDSYEITHMWLWFWSKCEMWHITLWQLALWLCNFVTCFFVALWNATHMWLSSWDFSRSRVWGSRSDFRRTLSLWKNYTWFPFIIPQYEVLFDRPINIKLYLHLFQHGSFVLEDSSAEL